MSESNLMKAIMLALSEAGCTVWRNQSGAYTDPRSKNFIRYGVGVGGSDILGIAPNGKFLAVEVKTATGRPTKEQLNFIDVINKRGGIAGIARSVNDALALINGART